MNITTANRLYNYRKRHGMSQEELAEKIGVSRQAVSKWERAEASPDTDNLIALSKIYGVTLDELLQEQDDINNNEENNADFTNASSADDENAAPEDGVYDDSDEEGDPHISFKNGIHVHADNGDRVDIGWRGIHVDEKDGDHVHIGWRGIHVDEKDGDNVHIGTDGIHVNSAKYARENSKAARFFREFPFWALAIVGFVVWGLFDAWAVSWLAILTIPLYYSLVEAICRRSANCFAFPVLVLDVYLFMGIQYSMWHPWWALFLLIPFYYFIVNAIKKD